MHTAARNAEPTVYAVLAAEHRLIERGLDLLDRFCDQIRRTKKMDAPVANGIVSFLREFADVTHHLKEERILFPAIEAKGFFPGCGLIMDHQTSRSRVQAMAAAVDGAAGGDAEARATFVRQARSYITMLRSHIAKEDDCLASVCARTFDAADAVRLSAAFGELEHREVGEAAFERFAALLEGLEARVADGSSAAPA